MHRASLVFLVMIALLAGFIARTVVLDSSQAVVSPPEAAGIETVRDFYDEINAVLGGAPAARLGTLLSPIFVDHDSSTGQTRTGEELLAAIGDAGAVQHSLQLELLSIEPSGANVIVEVQPVALEAIEVAGLKARPQFQNARVEMLRVHGGQIVDRWAPGDTWIETREFDGIPPAISSSIGVTTSVTRIELMGSDERVWRMEGVGIAIVETGTALLQITQDASWIAPTRLAPGAFAPLHAGARVRLRAADGEPVSIVFYQATRVMASQPVRTAPEGANATAGSQQHLWRGTRYWTGADKTHQPAMVVLPAESQLTIALPAGVEVLVGTNSAGIELTGPTALFSIVGENDWAIQAEGPVTVDASHAAWVDEGSGSVIVRNTASSAVTIWLIAVRDTPKTEPGDLCAPPCNAPPYLPVADQGED